MFCCEPLGNRRRPEKPSPRSIVGFGYKAKTFCIVGSAGAGGKGTGTPNCSNIVGVALFAPVCVISTGVVGSLLKLNTPVLNAAVGTTEVFVRVVRKRWNSSLKNKNVLFLMIGPPME